MITSATFVCLGFTTQAFAGGAYIYEMLPTAVGTTGVGLGAKAQNTSTAFDDPSGMTYIDHAGIEARVYIDG